MTDNISFNKRRQVAGFYFLVVVADEELVDEVEEEVVGLEVPAGRAGPGQEGRDTVDAVVRVGDAVTGFCVVAL